MSGHTSRWAKRDDMVMHQEDPFNAEPPPDALAGQPLTPLDAFYSRNHGAIPIIDPTSWQLEVGGLVDHPLTLSLDDLRGRFASHSVVATLQCAGNRRAGLMEVRDIPGELPWGPGAMSTAEWTGARLADVLAAAGMRAGAGHVAFDAPDVSPAAEPPQPYGGSIPAPKAMSDEVLLAWAMNGEDLPAVHGGPVRVVVPGYIGARSVKWVHRIAAQAEPSDNYFQAKAYRLLPAQVDPAQAGPDAGLSLGPTALNAAILCPAGGAIVPTGPLEVSGYALAGEHRVVARVDVSTDAGDTWQQAVLDEAVGPWAWRLWRATAVLTAGDVEIVARAWDTSGACQPESARHLWNPKGYVNSSWPRLRVHARPGDAAG